MSATRALWAALFVAVAASLLLGRAAAEDADSLNPMKAIDKASLESFVQKPLFDPTRELPPPLPPVVMDTAPPPPPPPAPPPNLQLLGVVHGRHDMAFVHKDGSEKTVVLRTGQTLDGWTVVVRPPLGVALRQGNREVSFAIFAKPGAGTGASPLSPPIAVGQMVRRPPDR